VVSFGLVQAVLFWICLNYVSPVCERGMLTVDYFATLGVGSQLLSSLAAGLRKPSSPRLEPRTVFQGCGLCLCNLFTETGLDFALFLCRA
jgi:hypothetical protein